MIKITFVHVDGARRVIEAKPGYSVMETAVKNGAPGIVGECGGMRACGTCRAYIDPEWRKVTGEPSEAESQMIEFAGDEDPRARLTCQIRITEELDGLVVHTPASQF